jgi:hypothetical protein
MRRGLSVFAVGEEKKCIQYIVVNKETKSSDLSREKKGWLLRYLPRAGFSALMEGVLYQ